MNRLLMLIATLSAAFLSTYIYAADDDWVSAVETDSAVIYIRTSDIKTNLTYSYTEAWEKYVTKKDSSYLIVKSRYYCLSDKAQTLESHSYSKSGKYLSGDRKADTAEFVIPDSVRQELLGSACLAGAITELLSAHYADGGDISDTSSEKITKAFGPYSVPAIIYYFANRHELGRVIN